MRQSRKELIERIEQLQQQVQKLESTLQQMSRPVIEQLTIERVYLQNPVLEKLEFAFDRIDIKDLSGALNLGNNFGTTVDPLKTKIRSNSSTSPSTEKETPIRKDTQGSGYDLERTSSGYRMKWHKREENST